MSVDCSLDLSRFRVVVVTGPQRSGTTIAARIIAEESGMRYVDEDEYGTKDVAAWKKLVTTGQGLVVHSPAMARWAHEAAADDVMVVWMIRPLDDILHSQKRIGWDDKSERAKYRDCEGYHVDAPVAVIKNRFWTVYQRGLIPHTMNLKYKDLSWHRLWVGTRKGWDARQWEES